MPSILHTFNVNRSAIAETIQLSSENAVNFLERIKTGVQPDQTIKKEVNKADAYTSLLGLLRKADGEYHLTSLGEEFLRLQSKYNDDVWRWLLTRSLWLYVVPNGTAARVNVVARRHNLSFSFFRLIIQILKHLQAYEGEHRYLYFDEFCTLLSEDTNWAQDALELTRKIITDRSNAFVPSNKRGFLGELEVSFGLPRDNYSGLFIKTFKQTGLFEYYKNGQKPVGIALKANLDEVLQRRIRFIIDNPPDWNPTNSWAAYLSNRADDMPFEVTTVNEESLLPAVFVSSNQDVSKLISDATEALNSAGLRVSSEIIKRYLAALFTKPFVMLSGLTGSGKTKLAQLIAQWVDSPEIGGIDPFTLGTEIRADRATYIISEANNTEIALRNSEGKITPFPRKLISEWSRFIEENNLGRETSADSIRDQVKIDSIYVPFIHGSASHLKALAFHYLDQKSLEQKLTRYEIVPVEANWTSTEDVFGYADALDNKRFSRKPALDLILRAKANYESSVTTLPYFLILDEMNLSHVERYFATILSALESGEAITLHSDSHDRNGVPAKVTLPSNLFIIGTVNVDETTYQFSPKVLDRANVIEFRVSEGQMIDFLKMPKVLNAGILTGKGIGYAASFLSISKHEAEVTDKERELFEDEMMLFYTVLASHGMEFGFRTAKEIIQYIQKYKTLNGGILDFQSSLDAQILQKILPKLHGSQRKLEPLLRSLAILCHEPRTWQGEPGTADTMDLRQRLLDEALAASDIRKKDLDPLNAKVSGSHRFQRATAYLPLSFEKITRMLERVNRDGFTSFAEA